MVKRSKKTETTQKVNSRFLTNKVRFKRHKNESRQTLYIRRRKWYTDPTKGGSGVCIKQGRCRTTIRRIRKNLNPSFNDLLGSTKDKKQYISPSYVEVVTGALDALGNHLLKLTSEAAEHRVGKTKSNTGMKMLKRDLELAIRTHNRYS